MAADIDPHALHFRSRDISKLGLAHAEVAETVQAIWFGGIALGQQPSGAAVGVEDLDDRDVIRLALTGILRGARGRAIGGELVEDFFGEYLHGYFPLIGRRTVRAPSTPHAREPRGAGRDRELCWAAILSI